MQTYNTTIVNGELKHVVNNRNPIKKMHETCVGPIILANQTTIHIMDWFRL